MPPLTLITAQSCQVRMQLPCQIECVSQLEFLEPTDVSFAIPNNPT